MKLGKTYFSGSLTFDEGNNVIGPSSATFDTITVSNTLNVTGNIAGAATTASYVEFTDIANKPTLISSSNQLAGETVDGDLTVTGKLTAQEFHTEYVSGSIIYTSGSTKFGDSYDDIHQFTGSLSSVYASSDVTSSFTANGGQVTIEGDDTDLNFNLISGSTRNIAEIRFRGDGVQFGEISGDKRNGNITISTDTAEGVVRINNTLGNILNVTGSSVGIGTESPSEKLHIHSGRIKIVDNEYDDWVLYKQRTDGTQTVGFKSHTSSGFSLWANGGEAIRIDGNQKVGINQDVPAYQLDVNSGATNVAARFESTDGTAAIMLKDNTGNVELSATGNAFSVQPGGGSAAFTIASDNNATFSKSDDMRVSITDTGDSSTLILRADATNEIYTNTNHDLRIYTNGNQTGQIHLKQSNGFVGIGTSLPGQKFSVQGEIAKYTTSGYDGTFDNLIKYGYSNDLRSGGTGNTNRWIGFDASVTAGPAGSNVLRARAFGGGQNNDAPVNIVDFRGDATSFFYDTITVDGSIYSTYDGNNFSRFGRTSTGGYIQAYSGGNENIMLRSYGDSYIANDLGIGSTSPNGKLDVNGTFIARGITSDNVAGGSTSTSGWYKLVAFGSRGGGKVTLSFTGGSYTPVTYVIYYYKNWTNSLTLKLEKYGQAGYITKARCAYDSDTGDYVVEIYATGTTSFAIYHDRQIGYSPNSSVYTDSLPAGHTNGTIYQTLRFYDSGTTTQLSATGQLLLTYGDGLEYGQIVRDGNYDFLIIGNGDVGLGFLGAAVDGTRRIIPRDPDGSTSNALIDLGDAGSKFQDIFASNGTIQTSDANEKSNIQNSDLGLDFISRLTPRSYVWNTGTRTHYGLVSQEVETVLEDINKSTDEFAGFIKSDVSEAKDGSEYSYGLRYQEFIAPMIKAIQELKEENDSLKARIQALEG